MRASGPGFTMIEILIVLAIISMMIALLMPALTSAKERAKMIQCASNLRQIGQALHIYAHDHDGIMIYEWDDKWNTALPQWIDKVWAGHLAFSNYMPPVHKDGRPHGVWRCPSTRPDDYSWPYVADYGVYEGVAGDPPGQYATISRYIWDGSTDLVRPVRLDRISNPSSALLVADAGSPKPGTQAPGGGYLGYFNILAGDAAPHFPLGWTSSAYQPACRHMQRSLANVCYVDGHVESLTHSDILYNKGNFIWANEAYSDPS